MIRSFTRRVIRPTRVPQLQAALFPAQRCEFSSDAVPPVDTDAKLRNDIKLLGQILGDIVKKENPEIYDSVERLRRWGREWRAQPQGCSLTNMVNDVAGYDSNLLKGVSRAFTHFLSLSNSAENHHRVRRNHERILTSELDVALSPKQDSCYGTVLKLKKEYNIRNELIFDALSKQHIEIVLTAHPTEVNRRTMIQKHQRIIQILDSLDRNDLTHYERRQLISDLRAQIAAIWHSDEIRRSKPTPVDEAKTGLAIVENVLWRAVPQFLRKLDDVTRRELGKSLPLTASPVSISSWMGGDRDGNPNVTPAITREVSFLSRWVAASLLKGDIAKLRSELSMRNASPELLAATNNAHEPYRHVLRTIENRLQATIEWADSQVRPEVAVVSQCKPYRRASEILEPLLMIYRSLEETNNKEIAEGNLTDTIRRLNAFGLTLMPLDIRQESTRHSEALDAITRYIGIGSYMQWDEQTRRNWLQTELMSKRPFLPRCVKIEDLGFSPSVVDTLKTFELISELGADSFGAYVISQCQQASDVLAVALLQKEAGVLTPMRVVPLFETLDDLQRSAETVDALFSMPAYRGIIGNKQECMVGYSDSAKDAGRLAASWAQYNAQTDMVNVAKKFGVELTFFHGKGGTVGRGGNPAQYQAILAHPPDTIQGRFRVTEQGEMITQNLGQDAMAERTFDRMTAGVLAERFIERPAPKKEWVEVMGRLSESSCSVYRDVVRGEPRFVPYFRSATPELELSGLNVGSRPAKRNPKGGVESLRAIPWVFAWTQTRLNLPTWLGVGESIQRELDTNPNLIKQMYKEWPWFRTVIDLLEMILVKSEEKIAENYDKQLVADAESVALGKELRQKLALTTKAVLAVSGNESLQANNPVLLRSLTVRNPYVDPLNIVQAELLKRLRSTETVSDSDRDTIKDALLITINGIANGMRNSG